MFSSVSIFFSACSRLGCVDVCARLHCMLLTWLGLAHYTRSGLAVILIAVRTEWVVDSIIVGHVFKPTKVTIRK